MARGSCMRARTLRWAALAACLTGLVACPDHERGSDERDVTAAIRMGVMDLYVRSAGEGKEPVYPERLDDEPAGTRASRAHPLFIRVVEGGVAEGWAKTGENTYTGPSGLGYLYVPAEGRLYFGELSGYGQGSERR
ncbi:MAG: hypothetical protein JXR96_07180 [Deltaproteobacteria bacterium]|nr:hypothetical protein [Deltaproteobacteria bacterium]